MKKLIGVFLAVFLAASCLKADNTAPAFTPKGTYQYTVLTYTATNLSLSYTAQVPYGKIMASVTVISGGLTWFDLTTTPTPLTTTPMPFNASAGASGILYGPETPGTWLHMVATSSSAVINVHVETVP